MNIDKYICPLSVNVSDFFQVGDRVVLMGKNSSSREIVTDVSRAHGVRLGSTKGFINVELAKRMLVKETILLEKYTQADIDVATDWDIAHTCKAMIAQYKHNHHANL